MIAFFSPSPKNIRKCEGIFEVLKKKRGRIEEKKKLKMFTSELILPIIFIFLTVRYLKNSSRKVLFDMYFV
jgi:hypothetical protein